MKEECGNCRYFRGYRCRRRAPIVGLVPEVNEGFNNRMVPETYFPPVLTTDWCGEWHPIPLQPITTKE